VHLIDFLRSPIRMLSQAGMFKLTLAIYKCQVLPSQSRFSYALPNPTMSWPSFGVIKKSQMRVSNALGCSMPPEVDFYDHQAKRKVRTSLARFLSALRGLKNESPHGHLRLQLRSFSHSFLTRVYLKVQCLIQWYSTNQKMMF